MLDSGSEAANGKRFMRFEARPRQPGCFFSTSSFPCTGVSLRPGIRWSCRPGPRCITTAAISRASFLNIEVGLLTSTSRTKCDASFRVLSPIHQGAAIVCGCTAHSSVRRDDDLGRKELRKPRFPWAPVLLVDCLSRQCNGARRLRSVLLVSRLLFTVYCTTPQTLTNRIASLDNASLPQTSLSPSKRTLQPDHCENVC